MRGTLFPEYVAKSLIDETKSVIKEAIEESKKSQPNFKGRGNCYDRTRGCRDLGSCDKCVLNLCAMLSEDMVEIFEQKLVIISQYQATNKNYLVESL